MRLTLAHETIQSDSINTFWKKMSNTRHICRYVIVTSISPLFNENKIEFCAAASLIIHFHQTYIRGSLLRNNLHSVCVNQQHSVNRNKTPQSHYYSIMLLIHPLNWSSYSTLLHFTLRNPLQFKRHFITFMPILIYPHVLCGLQVYFKPKKFSFVANLVACARKF